jgi:hypothetical protein
MSTPTDTPRTDEAYFANGATMYSLAGEMKLLERELVAMTARAEKAEAKLHALTLICGTNDANKFQSWVDKERERADKAEAECLEQARLLGISGSREASLIARLEKAETELTEAKADSEDQAKWALKYLRRAEEAEADTARLDWLAVSDVWLDIPATEAFTPETMREAIDAAMKEASK